MSGLSTAVETFQKKDKDTKIKEYLENDVIQFQGYQIANNLGYANQIKNLETSIDSLKNPVGYLEGAKKKLDEIRNDVNQYFMKLYEKFLQMGMADEDAKNTAMKYTGLYSVQQDEILNYQIPPNVLSTIIGSTNDMFKKKQENLAGFEAVKQQP